LRKLPDHHFYNTVSIALFFVEKQTCRHMVQDTAYMWFVKPYPIIIV
jgi:hypothetical protein